LNEVYVFGILTQIPERKYKVLTYIKYSLSKYHRTTTWTFMQSSRQVIGSLDRGVVYLWRKSKLAGDQKVLILVI